MKITRETIIFFIQKILTVLIFLLILDYLLGSFSLMMSMPNTAVPTIVNFSVYAFGLIIAIFLIRRNNIIADIILFCMLYNSLELFGQLFSFFQLKFFIQSPQPFFTDLLELLILGFLVLHLIFMLIEMVKPTFIRYKKPVKAFQNKHFIQFKAEYCILGFFIMSFCIIILFWFYESEKHPTWLIPSSFSFWPQHVTPNNDVQFKSFEVTGFGITATSKANAITWIHQALKVPENLSSSNGCKYKNYTLKHTPEGWNAMLNYQCPTTNS